MSRLLLRSLEHRFAIAGALVSGAADVANNAIAEVVHVKPIALDHETFRQVVVLMLVIATTGLAFAILERRQR